MNTLTIFYDARCGLCSSVRRWLMSQPAYVQIDFLPYDSPEASVRCPPIRQLHADREIIVMADTGELWQGAGAWVMCLWALRDFREWSQRFAAPVMQALARKIVHLVSSNRLTLSALLRLRSDDALRSLPEVTEASTCSLAG
ncbi:MAG: DUF393 domain-containing protein [Verrucomicrobiaceae bacterium]|nr:DUF393 domain-containing protein [Verrucomicrobiaceae bacterium]